MINNFLACSGIASILLAYEAGRMPAIPGTFTEFIYIIPIAFKTITFAIA